MLADADQSNLAREREPTEWKRVRKQLEARQRKPYLYIVVLPKGGVLLQLEPRGSRGGASELVVEVVRRHRGHGGGGGGVVVLGRLRRRRRIGGAGGGVCEMEMGFGLKWGADRRKRNCQLGKRGDVGRPISNLGSHPRTMSRGEKQNNCCMWAPPSRSVDFELCSSMTI